MKRRQRKEVPPENKVDDWAEATGQPSSAAPDNGELETGWTATSAGLSGIAKLVRVGAWVLIASGPLLGLAGLLGSSATAQGAPAPAAPVTQPASDTGPSGFAQLFVAAYLEAGRGSEKTLAPYYSGSVTLTSVPGSRSSSRTVAVASQEVGAGYWSVTVAARVANKDAKGTVTDAGLQYFQVAVQVLGTPAAGGAAQGQLVLGYAATALPAQIAAPASLTPSALGYPTSRGSNPTDPATQTVSGFLSAYLAGKGDLNRYTSPGVVLLPVAPAPYTAIKITELSDDSEKAADNAVPGDGKARQVLAKVAATDTTGTDHPMTYALTLRSRGGRWEVASLGAAPLLQPGSKPAVPTPTASPNSDSPAPAESQIPASPSPSAS
ncbi:conjugal transfer protein [Streptomyces sp. NPDC048270]|uniref:conjugal transfer protein n=1 Tax=Streptomyces sp. NPDC048270 TaxID=3154615 RepID=UPI0033C82871